MSKDNLQELRYGAALDELEQILEALEDNEIDVDDLSRRVKRASELIQHCRSRLTRTKAEIQQVMAEFEDFEQEAQAEE